MIGTLDIEIYDIQKDNRVQGKYLVHGHDDVLWTNDIVEAIMFFTESLRTISDEPKKDMEGFCADCGARCDYC